MSELSERPRRTGAFWLDLVVAISAVVISVVSLFVAQRADRTQERLLAASVWPFVEFHTSNISPTYERFVTLSLRNAGVGPARIRWMTVEYRKRPIANPRDLLSDCCDPKPPHALAKTLITSSVVHSVLVPRETRDFILVRPNAKDKIAYDAFDHLRRSLHIRACYCSVLGDCWIMDNLADGDPKTVSNCSQPRETLFQS